MCDRMKVMSNLVGIVDFRLIKCSYWLKRPLNLCSLVISHQTDWKYRLTFARLAIFVELPSFFTWAGSPAPTVCTDMVTSTVVHVAFSLVIERFFGGLFFSFCSSRWIAVPCIISSEYCFTETTVWPFKVDPVF